MTIPIWCLAASVPILMSLGYLAGEVIAFTTTKELQAAWVLLALRVQEFLAKCNAAEALFDQDDLAPLSEAIRLLEDLHELPKGLAAGASSDRCD